jgi:hypothetical protein
MTDPLIVPGPSDNEEPILKSFQLDQGTPEHHVFEAEVPEPDPEVVGPENAPLEERDA